MNLLLNPLSVEAQLISRFGWRNDPIKHIRKLHEGIDLDSVVEQVVGLVAIADGVVVKLRDSITWSYSKTHSIRGIPTGFYAGNYVHIDCGHGVVIEYYHMLLNSVKVVPGQKVEKGNKIGIMGSSGYSTAPHLHLVIRINGTPVDPLPYLTGQKQLIPSVPAPHQSAKALVKGAGIILKGAGLYTSSETRQPVKIISGNYRLVDGKIINGRLRIIQSRLPAALLKVSSTVGWVKASDIHVL